MAVYVRTFLCCVGIAFAATTASGESVPAGSVADIEERTRPFGELCLEGDDCGGVESSAPVVAGPSGRDGAEVYAGSCGTCHEAGLNQAPKVGDLEAWGPRLEKGIEELVRVSREGLNLMPPMGACVSCTDDELRAAIEFMTDEPGDAG